MIRHRVRHVARQSLSARWFLVAAFLGAGLIAAEPTPAQQKNPAAARTSQSKPGIAKTKPPPPPATAKPSAAKATGPKSAPANPALAKPVASVPADDKLIVPFVGENTFLVARLDL